MNAERAADESRDPILGRKLVCLRRVENQIADPERQIIRGLRCDEARFQIAVFAGWGKRGSPYVV